MDFHYNYTFNVVDDVCEIKMRIIKILSSQFGNWELTNTIIYINRRLKVNQTDIHIKK